MKYLVLLGLLLGCKPSLYKKGDCIRVYGITLVQDFLIIDIFKEKYVVNPAFKLNGTPSYLPSTKMIFEYKELADNSKKILCDEVE